MKRRTFLILSSITLSFVTIFAQFEDGRYYFSHEIETMLAEGSLRLPSASTHYSVNADYWNMAQYNDIEVAFGVDTLDLFGYQIKTALPFILKEAKKARIIIISESHSKPQHRIFTKSLLPHLKELGFQNLFMEALSVNLDNKGYLFDSLLIERGYPLNSFTTGTYTRTPEMATMLKFAIENGWKINGYERSNITGQNEERKDRDEFQADNIIAQIEENKIEKLVIHCGWWHAVESDLKKGGRNAYWLAKYLKDKTGIDPLTIYQDNFTEKFIYNEHPILNELDINAPSVFTEADTIVRLSSEVDIEVIHPKTQWINGRPSWLYQDSTYQAYLYDIQSIEMSFPVFIKAFRPGETADGVPVDIVEVKGKYDNRYLVLPPGNYEFIITNGQEIKKENIVID